MGQSKYYKASLTIHHLISIISVLTPELKQPQIPIICLTLTCLLRNIILFYSLRKWSQICFSSKSSKIQDQNYVCLFFIFALKHIMLCFSELKTIRDCSSSYVLAQNRSMRIHWYVHLTGGEFHFSHFMLCTFFRKIQQFLLRLTIFITFDAKTRLMSNGLAPHCRKLRPLEKSRMTHGELAGCIMIMPFIFLRGKSREKLGKKKYFPKGSSVFLWPFREQVEGYYMKVEGCYSCGTVTGVTTTSCISCSLDSEGLCSLQSWQQLLERLHVSSSWEHSSSCCGSENS